MRAAAVLFLVFTGSACGVLPRFSASPRVRQAATPLDYARELYDQMYSINSTTVSGETDPPSNVWCILDRGTYANVDTQTREPTNKDESDRKNGLLARALH